MEVDLSNLRYWCNDKFYPLMHDTHRYMVLMGGGGSGKSHFCAQKIVYRMLADPGIRILVVRKVKNTIKESVFTLLRDIISEWELSPLFKYNMSDYGIMCVTEIGLKLIIICLYHDDLPRIRISNWRISAKSHSVASSTHTTETLWIDFSFSTSIMLRYNRFRCISAYYYAVQVISSWLPMPPISDMLYPTAYA